jgi:hypothetical protein
MIRQVRRPEMASEPERAREPDPKESPFAVPAVEGIPFGKDSEEARAIRRVIEDSEAERADNADD